MLKKTLAIIGIGNMGGAIAKALVEQKVFSKENLLLCDRSAEKLSTFEEKASIEQNLEKVLSSTDAVLLCIKPQSIENFFSEWGKYFDKEVLLLSILAGTSIQTLQEKSGTKKIIRIMPNTPVQIRMGVSGFFASEEVSEAEKIWTKKILETFGIAIACKNEDQINSITALSGSGPAYFFHILEIFAQEAENFGFSTEDSRNIALQTLLGSGNLAKISDTPFLVLREKVTSKGGTTEAALKSFQNNHLTDIFQHAIQSAYKKAVELGENKKDKD
jgi:pyrroline-5-carboxylate reductase